MVAEEKGVESGERWYDECVIMVRWLDAEQEGVSLVSSVAFLSLNRSSTDWILWLISEELSGPVFKGPGGAPPILRGPGATNRF